MTPEPDLVVRSGRWTDLPVLVRFAGSEERAYWRLQGSDAGTEALLVAEYGDELAGVVSVRWDAPCDPPNPWLYGLYVRPDVRHCGAGARLVRAAEALAASRGSSVMSLDVDRDEDALVTYYERLGYVRAAPHLHHWRSVDPRTGAVLAEGDADTWLMRHVLGPPHRT